MVTPVRCDVQSGPVNVKLSRPAGDGCLAVWPMDKERGVHIGNGMKDTCTVLVRAMAASGGALSGRQAMSTRQRPFVGLRATSHAR